MSSKEDKIRGERLRQLRRAAGFTQRHVEQALGMPHSRISHLENGKAVVTMKILEQLASFYGSQPDDLLRPLPGKMPKLPVEGSNLLEVSSAGKRKLRLRIDRVMDWQLVIKIVQMIGEAELSEAGRDIPIIAPTLHQVTDAER